MRETPSAWMRRCPPRICGGPSERCDFHWKRKTYCRAYPTLFAGKGPRC